MTKILKKFLNVTAKSDVTGLLPVPVTKAVTKPRKVVYDNRIINPK